VGLAIGNPFGGSGVRQRETERRGGEAGTS
jgi:hypothetical protein